MKPFETSQQLKEIIPLSLAGKRLDVTLVQLFPMYSRTQLQKLIQQHCVQIDHQWMSQPNFKVRRNQCITLTIKAASSDTTWIPKAIPLDLIYEDAALLVVNKPAGLVTHPAPGHLNHTLVNALLHYLPSLAQLPRAGIIHRLDRDTSGLLLVPKTLTSYAYCVQQLAQRKIQRIYLAIVQGFVISGGHVDLPIGRHLIYRQQQAINLRNGKPAVTHYRIKERFSRHTLLKVTLETGRTHQIRVHMAHISHALVGDPVYKNNMRHTRKSVAINPTPLSQQLKSALQKFTRQALHAHQLGIYHPLTQQFQQWTAPIPSDMQHLLEVLRAD